MGAPVMLQIEAEIAGFANLLRDNGVRSYLEIGSKFGGSLDHVARKLPKGSRIVAVDLPKGTRAWPESEKSLRAVVDGLKADGYDAHLIWGDSTDARVIAEVARLGPFDAAFIDGNHTMPFLEKDWTNYGPIARIVGFHDVNWKRPAEWVGVRIDVPEFWAKIRQGRQHHEWCFDEKDNGIGALIW